MSGSGPYASLSPRKKQSVFLGLPLGAEVFLVNFEDLDSLGDKHNADIIVTTKVEVVEILKDK